MLIGVVGKANVGKSTFFKAQTLANVEIANYPFATIKPNSGVGYVKIDCADKHFGVQCNPREGFCRNHKRFIPVQLIDVAGLVPGAYEGKGMGNQFLDDLRQADALIHVIDVAGTTNEKGEPVNPGSYDPANDVRFLEVELDMWYLGILKKGWEKFVRTVQQEKRDIRKAIAKQLSALKVTEELVKEVTEKLGLDVDNPLAWQDEDLHKIAMEFRKLTKRMVIAANKADLPPAKANIDRLRQEFPQHTIIGCSADCELALREASKAGLIDYIPGNNDFSITSNEKLNDNQRKALAFIKTNVLDKYGSTGVQEVLNQAVFGTLGYVAIFPGGINKLADSDGNVLPDCFLMPPGTTALDFAFRLHSDFGNNFIRAIDVKKRIAIGKEHMLQSGDVVEIVSGK